MQACIKTNTVIQNTINTQEILDIQTIPQSLSFFLEQVPNSLLISKEESQNFHKRYQKEFFRVWHQKKFNKNSVKYFQSILNLSPARRTFAENLLVWTPKNWETLQKNARLSEEFFFARNAIIVENTSLRIVPSNKPLFYNPKIPGDAYPFDMFQNSAVALGTPIKVYHISADHQWYYVETSLVSGWVENKTVAFVNDSFMKKWETSLKYAGITTDLLPMRWMNVYTIGRLGSTFPIMLDHTYHYVILVPFKKSNGKAGIATMPISKKDAILKPLRFTQKNVAAVAEQLMGNPYGWGGMYGNRDCSSTLQDIFALFDIPLPRNSMAQGNFGEVISLKDMSDEEKEHIILTQGIPFQTLIYLPGHIGLYVGQYENKAVIFHNLWGVKLQNDGRFIIGKAVITSLYAGMELSDVKSSIMERVQSMNILK